MDEHKAFFAVHDKDIKLNAAFKTADVFLGLSSRD